MREVNEQGGDEARRRKEQSRNDRTSRTRSSHNPNGPVRQRETTNNKPGHALEGEPERKRKKEEEKDRKMWDKGAATHENMGQRKERKEKEPKKETKDVTETKYRRDIEAKGGAQASARAGAQTKTRSVRAPSPTRSCGKQTQRQIPLASSSHGNRPLRPKRSKRKKKVERGPKKAAETRLNQSFDRT